VGIGEPVTVAEASFLFAPTETYRNTPIREVYETGKTLRRELHLDSYPDDYSIVGEFRADGMTDYIACPLHFLNGEIHAVSWNTRRPGGFRDADIASLERVTAPLARLAEVCALRRVAENLLNTYVGERSGSQILAGNIRPGDTEIIEAAIWLSDLREFTILADTVSGTEPIATLNSRFNCLVPAIFDHGGAVLKFIGDGLLAVFQTGAGRNHAQVSEAAVQATIDACREMAKLNEERHAAGAPPLSFGLALNFGQIHYGNISAADLLDFTAIGPAVNLAARMEAIAAENGRDIVVSSEIQAELNIETESLGDFSVKGFAERVAIYAVLDNLLDQSP